MSVKLLVACLAFWSASRRERFSFFTKPCFRLHHGTLHEGQFLLAFSLLSSHRVPLLTHRSRVWAFSRHVAILCPLLTAAVRISGDCSPLSRFPPPLGFQRPTTAL